MSESRDNPAEPYPLPAQELPLASTMARAVEESAARRAEDIADAVAIARIRAFEEAVQIVQKYCPENVGMIVDAMNEAARRVVRE